MIDSLLLLIKFDFFLKSSLYLSCLTTSEKYETVVGLLAAARRLLPCPSTLAPRRRFGSLPPPLLLPLRSQGCCLALACGLARRAAEARRRCRSAVAARRRAARRHREAGGYDQGHGPARTGVGHHYAGGHGLAPRAGTAEPVGTCSRGLAPERPVSAPPPALAPALAPRRRARPRQRLRPPSPPPARPRSRLISPSDPAPAPARAPAPRLASRPVALVVHTSSAVPARGASPCPPA